MRKQIRQKKLMAGMMLLVMVLTGLCSSIGTIRAEAQGERVVNVHELTHYDTRYDEGQLRVGYFEIDRGIPAMCVCHEMEPPTQTGTVLKEVAAYTAENQGNELLRKVFYYGWNGPGDVGAGYVETTLASSVANGHDDNFYGYGQKFIDRIASLPAAPEGFCVYLLSDGVSDHQNLAYWEYEAAGYAKIIKSGTDTDITDQNPCYSLGQAIYGVYSDEACTKQKAEIKTSAAGESEEVELIPGKYYVKEIQAPAGYQLDSHIYPITIKDGETAEIQVQDAPVWNVPELTIYKVDKETKGADALGGAALSGAKVKISYYAGYYDETNLPDAPDRSWTLVTKAEETEEGTQYVCRLDESYLIDGDSFYEKEGKVILPLGTVMIEEVEAPKGYLKDQMCFRDGSGEIWEGHCLTQIRQDGNQAVLQGGCQYTMLDQVIRGDLKFTKIAAGSHKRLAGVPFRITSKTTGESHVLITDDNGFASTSSDWNQHTWNTNRGEKAEDGVWFGLQKDGSMTEAEDSLGALPFDTYIIEELRCESNQGYQLISPFEITIEKEYTTVDLGTLTNEKIKETDQTSGESGKKAESVRTGDGAKLSTWLLSSILSCAAIILCVMITRIMKKR